MSLDKKLDHRNKKLDNIDNLYENVAELGRRECRGTLADTLFSSWLFRRPVIPLEGMCCLVFLLALETLFELERLTRSGGKAIFSRLGCHFGGKNDLGSAMEVSSSRMV